MSTVNPDGSVTPRNISKPRISKPIKVSNSTAKSGNAVRPSLGNSKPKIVSKKNKKGETVAITKTSTGRRRQVRKKNKDVTIDKKGKKVLRKEVIHRNPDKSHKKTVTKTADGSKTVRKHKKNKKGHATSITRTKDSKGQVTTKREIYKKNKKGKAIVKTVTKGPNGKKTISRRKDATVGIPRPAPKKPRGRHPDAPKGASAGWGKPSSDPRRTTYIGADGGRSGTPGGGGPNPRRGR